MITITESNMQFGPFEEKAVFEIEKSSLYKELGEGIHIAEFIAVRDNKILLVEAKTTQPNPEGKERFRDSIDEIAEKLKNTFDIFISANCNVLKNINNENINLIQFNELHTYKIQFFLVIKKSEKEWLPPIQIALQEKLKPQAKIWNIEVFVLNHEKAKQYKLISA